MSYLPTVTVLIPARNEEADIERCLRAVLAQDHPHDRMEIVLVDGGSTDRTANVASDVLSTGDVDWKIVENPLGTTPSNLNAGLRVAIGGVLCRVDARSIIPPEYVRLCADVLTSRPEVRVTGGAQVAVPPDSSRRAIGIARALNNRYAMGGSRYRSGAPSGPTDTVYLGAFRTDQLRGLRGWNEFFDTNQDYELNRRMSREGMVWYDARLEVNYIPRRSIAAVWRQYRRFGRWKVRYWRSTGDPPQRRQVVALTALPGAVVFAAAALTNRRTPRLGAMGVLLPLALLIALEDRGARPADDRHLGVRAVSIMTLIAVVSGWTSGVAEQLVRTAARTRRGTDHTVSGVS